MTNPNTALVSKYYQYICLFDAPQSGSHSMIIVNIMLNSWYMTYHRKNLSGRWVTPDQPRVPGKTCGYLEDHGHFVNG